MQTTENKVKQFHSSAKKHLQFQSTLPSKAFLFHILGTWTHVYPAQLLVI